MERGYIVDIRTWAEKAILVQDACNMSGVVTSMRQWLHELIDQGHDTAYCNTHPVTVMFASKVHSLAGGGLTDELVFRHAHKKCQLLASGEIRAAV